MRWPDFLNLRRLEGRIVALFLALLLAVQCISLLLLNQGIDRNARASVREELASGERVFDQLLRQDAEQRGMVANLLQADFGLRRALAEGVTGDELTSTLEDVFTNLSERGEASFIGYADERYRFITATQALARQVAPLLPGMTREADSPKQGHLVLLQGKAYQVVVARMRAAGLGGWVFMGFELRQEQLQELQRIANIQGVLLARVEGRWQVLSSIMDPASHAALLAALPGGLGDDPLTLHLTLGDEQYQARLQRLEHAGDGSQIMASLLLRSVDEARAPYRQLQWSLLGLSLAGVAAFALGAVLTARRISGPVKWLAHEAQRLGRGDYEQPVARPSGDEIGDLAEAFEAMRLGIRQREEQVNRLAFWDPLTDLPNREQFSQTLTRRMADSEVRFALIMLNLDRFKHVNDVLGRAFGDRLLRAVAERLQRLLKDQARLIARLSGDEFVLLVEGAGATRAEAVCHRIQRDFERALTIDDQTVDLSAGLGIALYPQHGRDMSELMGRAELAMHAAKRSQSGFQIYAPSMDAASQESLSLISELRQAIENNELRLYLQPKVDLATQRIGGAEALVRWQHPVRGLVPPMDFIPFAEQTGFIRQLTSWMLRASAEAWLDLHRQGLAVPISVNLSTRDLMDQDLPIKIADLAGGVPPSALCLEITESAIMDDPQRALQTLEQLHALGFKLSIDDFGTGYSSLAYLKQLSVDELKIDRSFVMGMERDLDDAKIVRSTIELAHNLGLRVVAEGLETGKAWTLLETLGCDQAQGYFLARPMPGDQFAQWLRGWEPPDLGDAVANTVLAGL
ncbi:putative bifunctional diguanylate cyclase/phosphodiesterase [Roseateles depolymerans]|uniref:Cyclic di-GMP phosphodiesterase Gmr n=1 Tax=Roseateles depolymerans TaxID=76731 RepID=A0A0U3LV93_9BURK|nr:EAL domain-containing protein [Roseateles depolymerans]ALV09015.1 Cyclic di-GMP phosphodiesterase Gmr [Roseateles depolymerans]REG10098.1 diguanylate cyclase/phosphodiesterase [Roseateles depolymerans]